MLLSSVERHSCGTCKKLRNGTKVSRVLELPEVMCIHLKRFRHEYLGSSKISTRVSFPLENIDMGPYLHKGTFRPLVTELSRSTSDI
jgi:ubiquitin carboxyl-terminal hydrolase 20/33